MHMSVTQWCIVGYGLVHYGICATDLLFSNYFIGITISVGGRTDAMTEINIIIYVDGTSAS